MRRSGHRCLLILPAMLAFASAPASAGDFVHFESSHVHPLALSGAPHRLYAVNTPEARLAVFSVRGRGRLVFVGDVPVGLEPVSLAVRLGTHEVWVANHLSDSVSVVDGMRRKLIATIQVGDEPTDVVFASGRAFVSLAGNQDRVRIYDATTHEEVTSISILGDDPRAMAVSPDGKSVSLVVLESGNRTATVSEASVLKQGGLPDPDPPRDPDLPPAPLTSLVSRFDPGSGNWLDQNGQAWNHLFPLDLPDLDLFEIDAAAPVPSLIRTVSGVGTNLFEVAIHPQTGDAWVPNTDARNLVRFEPVLRGHLVETRVSIVDLDSGGVSPVDLNSHIDYSVTPGPPEEKAASLAIPGDGVFSSDGSTFYLAAFGSEKVGVLDGASGAVVGRIQVGGGPSGVALNERARRLYVMNRFDNTISTVNLDLGAEIAVIGVAGPSGFDPSPPEVREGRRFLYDAQLSSGHGDIACATCHVFAHFDGLVWDLGDPQGAFVDFSEADWVEFAGPPSLDGFDPMKGPMATQSLRGLLDNEPFHWRGDRRNLQHFNGAFVSLLGRGEPLSEAQINGFSDFAMTVRYPPNPYRNLDDSLPDIVFPFGDPANGEHLFRNVPLRPELGTKCVDCHVDPAGTNTLINFIAQPVKVAQLRGVYEKMNRQLPGPQKASLGPFHSASKSLFLFLALTAPNFPATERGDVIAFLNTFPSETFPCVGRQVTLRGEERDDPGALSTVGTLLQQVEAGRCDLIAKGVVRQRAVGYVYSSEADVFMPDREGDPPLGDPPFPPEFGKGDVLTYTGVPLGSGRRLGIDRDRDGCLDADERPRGDPADPSVNGCADLGRGSR